MSVDRFGNHSLIVCDDPTHFMGTAETPQDATDRPDVCLRTAMRTRPNGCATIEREWDHVVWGCGHDVNLITDRPFETVTRLSGQPLSPIYLWIL